MSNLERVPPGPETNGEDHEAEVRRLLERSGSRPEIPEEDLASITAAARATWRQQVAEPALSRRRWPLALAAVLVAALGAALWWSGVEVGSFISPSSTEVAEAQRIWGTASVEGEQGTEPVVQGQSLVAGSLIATTEDGAGTNDKGNRIALLLEEGTSLRLDQGTRLRLLSATEFELEAGALYVDTGLEERPAVTVHTPYGDVTDIGTQFSVRVPAASHDQEPLQVRVREGEVQVAAAGDIREVLAGTELLLTADGVGSSREISSYGPEWEWILDAAPHFDVEGMKLTDFLTWVSRETGWDVRIEDPSLAAAAEATILHGTTGSLRPDRAALAALTGAGLRGEVEDGTLIIRRAGS